MGKIKTGSLKISMAGTFLVTICVIGILSCITVFFANQARKEILRNQHIVIRPSAYKLDPNTNAYIIHPDDNAIEWHGLSMGENIAYYGCCFAMTGLPVLYTIAGIGGAAAIYYRVKLKAPILQLQKGMKRIQENDLDFCIEYNEKDELGQLCSSMEKMRKELRHKNKALWETLEQRKLLNASVAHDLRTPITVLRGYLDYLKKSIPGNKLTEEELLDTVSFMQKAVTRLEQYTQCVRGIEKIENIEVKTKPENVKLLIQEIESNVLQLAQGKEVVFENGIAFDEINIDKGVFFRILENLLQNAFRYAEKQVNINISKKDQFLILTVKDDGKGFSKTDLKKAAAMFYSREKEHFGIGLGICRILCEKHEGSLSVANNKEKGACVIARLKIF